MKLLKLFLTVLLFMFCTVPAMAGDITIDKDNGVYHIVLKGEKIKKKMKFVVSEDLITN